MAYKRRDIGLTEAEREQRMQDAEYWHLMRMAPNTVDDARYFLEDLGVAVAQPIANRWRRAGRGWKVRHVPVRARAFDGYLFLGVRGRGLMWSALHATGYFRAVIGFGSSPAMLDHVIVETVMQRARAGAFDDDAPDRLRASDIKLGDHVKLRNDGAFTGLTGPVDAVSELTAKVMLTLCGKPTLREIPLEDLIRMGA